MRAWLLATTMMFAAGSVHAQPAAPPTAPMPAAPAAPVAAPYAYAPPPRPGPVYHQVPSYPIGGRYPPPEPEMEMRNEHAAFGGLVLAFASLLFAVLPGAIMIASDNDEQAVGVGILIPGVLGVGGGFALAAWGSGDVPVER